MTYNSEAVEIFQMFAGILVGLWFYARIIFIVWAILSVTRSLSRISRNLERVVNRWDLEREANRTPSKAVAEGPESLV